MSGVGMAESEATVDAEDLTRDPLSARHEFEGLGNFVGGRGTARLAVGPVIWWILLACLVAFATKLAGYLLPESWLENRTMVAITSAMTIGLLGALIATNAVTRGQSLVLDSRLLAVVVALVALRLRAPFILVVVLGAASVALGRALGLP